MSTQVATRCGKWCNSTGSQAFLCKKCGLGLNVDKCAVCSHSIGVFEYRAQLCNEHGYGRMSDECCKCGKSCGNTKIVAHLCKKCGSRTGEDYCCKIVYRMVLFS